MTNFLLIFLQFIINLISNVEYYLYNSTERPDTKLTKDKCVEHFIDTFGKLYTERNQHPKKIIYTDGNIKSCNNKYYKYIFGDNDNIQFKMRIGNRDTVAFLGATIECADGLKFTALVSDKFATNVGTTYILSMSMTSPFKLIYEIELILQNIINIFKSLLQLLWMRMFKIEKSIYGYEYFGIVPYAYKNNNHEQPFRFNLLPTYQNDKIAKFDLRIQLCDFTKKTPINNTCMVWNVKYINIASLTINLQKNKNDNCKDGIPTKNKYCYPIGDVNETRQTIYLALSKIRKGYYGCPYMRH